MKVKIGQNVCRVCLQSKTDGVFLPHVEDLIIKLQFITNKEVSLVDGLSLKLCSNCVDALKSAYNFKLQCEKSEAQQRKFIENINSKLGQVSDKNAENSHTKKIIASLKPINKMKIEEDKIDPIINENESIADSSTKTFIDYNDDDDDYNENVEFLDEERLDSDDEEVNIEDSFNSTENVSIDDPLNSNKKVSKKKRKKRAETDLEEIFVCEICKEDFSTKSNLIRHTKNQHSDLRKMYQCHLCEVQVTTYSGLKTHISCRHINLKQFKCEYCSKGFNQKKQLVTHLLRHSNEKPYVCEKCGLGFPDSKSLNYHLKLHENDKGLQYQCQYCSVYFKTKTGKVSHERSQHNSDGSTIFSCVKCNSSFMDKHQLNEHKRVHVGERPFKCNQCERDFVRESMLIYHQKQHSRDDIASLASLNMAQKRMFLSTDKCEIPESTPSSKRKRRPKNFDFENKLAQSNYE